MVERIDICIGVNECEITKNPTRKEKKVPNVKIEISKKLDMKIRKEILNMDESVKEKIKMHIINMQKQKNKARIGNKVILETACTTKTHFKGIKISCKSKTPQPSLISNLSHRKHSSISYEKPIQAHKTIGRSISITPGLYKSPPSITSLHSLPSLNLQKSLDSLKKRNTAISNTMQKYKQITERLVKEDEQFIESDEYLNDNSYLPSVYGKFNTINLHSINSQIYNKNDEDLQKQRKIEKILKRFKENPYLNFDKSLSLNNKSRIKRTELIREIELPNVRPNLYNRKIACYHKDFPKLSIIRSYNIQH